MKKNILLLAILLISSFAVINAQQITFEDGTTVNVNHASFDYQSIRRASAGIMVNLDGLAGDKYAMVSYLMPEKFHLAANLGFSSLNLEGTIFFTGKTKQRDRSFSVKYESGGYNTIKRYVLKHPVEKRKEVGVYLAVNDYGHLINDPTWEPMDYPFTKQTTLYLGVATVNYWHANVNVDDNFMRRGQYIGRTIFTPFMTFANEVDTVGFTKADIPRYGARIMYELSNSIGALGTKIRGRTNLMLRAGFEAAVAENKNFTGSVILGFGLVYNFAEGNH
jgi:hypothetical protein